MNLEELRRIREQERATDSLQKLRADFYTDVADYLVELRVERDAMANNVDDPFTDPEVQRLTDELQAAERTVEALYERRVGKIVKLASFAAADMAVEVDGLTKEETELFDTIVETIREFSTQITETLEASASTGVEDTYRNEDASTIERSSKTDSEEAANVDQEDKDDETDGGTDRTTVRITEDVGPIVGVDNRDYHLDRDDIVTLPTENAQPLIDGDVAEPID